MKLYAYATPDIPKHDGYLKIGETHRLADQRISQQGGQVNVEKVPEWQDTIATERKGIDRLFRHFLRDKYGFHIQPNISGHGESEWVRCTVHDLKEAFPRFKEQFYLEQKERQIVTEKFYKEIRNWFYWTTQENQTIDADYAMRLAIRLLFCFFLREKNGLVPKELLDQSIEKLLKSDEEYSYYQGILRNLFFHCINTPDKREYENEKLLADKKTIKGWFSAIPFLNGGLFDEHEKDGIPIGNDYFFSEKRERSLVELDESCDVYGIITILSKYQYKLTLDNLLDQAEYSKTVDPEFIGKVFESLLSCIYADSQKTRQKITGSYYTPREIVDYMVNSSLDVYLETKRQTDTESSDTELLLQCKILDPACGSGAFPCDIMNEIIHRIDPERKLDQLGQYRRKLEIVRKVIYGVDIQPMAVQITLLRFFLSLIQDIIPDKQKKNYGIDPLPNLETKFVCADALIGLEKQEKNGQRTLESPKVTETIRDLQSLRNDYFMASTVQEKDRIRKYDATLRRILMDLMEGAFASDATEKLAKWNPYDQTNVASFFDPMWMFGISEGFDIVIGNPPYGAKYPAENKKYFLEHYKTAKTTTINGGNEKIQKKGSLDTFSLFTENGFDRLNDNGYLTYIVPIAVVSSDSMMALHELLFNHCETIKVSSYAKRPVQIFRNACIANTIISFVKTNTKCERIFTTKMNRLTEKGGLKRLLGRLKFIDARRFCMRGRVPKISLPIEKRILKKLFAKRHTTIRHLIDDEGKPVYYRSSGGRYYNVVTNYLSESTKEKSVLLDPKFTDTIGAILSSNLFWWYQQVYSNSLDLKSYEIESFPIPIDNLTAPVRRKIGKLYERYLQDIERHVIEHETKEYKHVTRYKEYKLRYSKGLIDAMDDAICPLYGLTDEELEFIKKYELRFRIDD